MKKITLLFLTLLISLCGVAQELVTNGDFQTGDGTSWYNGALKVVDLGGGTWVNEANVLAVGNPWDANISQDINLQDGKTYELSYDAWTDAITGTRSMTAALGQNGPGWASLTASPALTSTSQKFTHEFTINYGDAVNDRVIFDMGAETGYVFIDNVSVIELVPDLAKDATLSHLTINGTTITGFGSGTLTYDVELPEGTTAVPTTVGTPTQASPATAVTTDAGSLPGTSTILVTAQDQTTTKIYTINFTVATPTPLPTVAAPTPPSRDAANVVSVYSDAYTSISPINYDAGWCGGTGAVTETTAAGDNIFAYNDKGCQGIDFDANRQDITGFTDLHVDLFIAAGTDLIGKVFNLKIETADSNITIPIDVNGLSPAPVPGTWYSFDTTITNTGASVMMRQLVITSNLNNAIWYDNLYLHKITLTPGTCTDGMMNQDETGIDCGGSSCVPCTGPPSSAAPTPEARDAANVISFYSDAYTDTGIDDFDFGLCASSPATTEVMIAGNATQNYTGGDCQGIDIQNNRIDASSFTNIHFDFYTDETDLIGKVFNIKLVDWAGNTTESGSSGLEINFNDGSGLVSGAWVSIDVDITAIGGRISGNLTRSDIAQIHITSNLPNAWYDNLYLWKEPNLGINDVEIEGLKAYPNPTSNQWTISTKDQVINSIDVYDVSGKKVISLQPNAISTTVDASSLNAGMYISTITTNLGTVSRKLIKK
jgi:hypothetical protein